MSERHLIRTSTNILLVKDGKILLSRRQNTDWEDGKLCIPGGHVESGETPKIAAIREVAEELGLEISIGELQFYCVAQRKSIHEYVAYEFYVELDTDQKPTNTEPKLCSELVWVDPRNLPDDVIADFADIINEGFVNKTPYLELGY